MSVELLSATRCGWCEVSPVDERREQGELALS